MHRARLPLYSDPLRWLMNGRRGAVVLDWSQAGFLFDGLEGITGVSPRPGEPGACNDPAHEPSPSSALFHKEQKQCRLT
jgi:hypothetical protein